MNVRFILLHDIRITLKSYFWHENVTSLCHYVCTIVMDVIMLSKL